MPDMSRCAATSGQAAAQIGEHPAVNHAAAIAGRHRAALGFVMRASLETAQRRGELYTSEHAMACIWHRRDRQTTLHTICSEQPGEGGALLDRIVGDALSRGQTTLLARCPEGLPANEWYGRRGFTLVRTEPGRGRPLNVWVLPLR